MPSTVNSHVSGLQCCYTSPRREGLFFDAHFFLSKLYDGLTYFFFFRRMYGMPGWPHGRIDEELLGVSFPNWRTQIGCVQCRPPTCCTVDPAIKAKNIFK